MPYKNYSSGQPEGFRDVSGETVKNNVWARGGKMHGCMPGCVVQCSIIYNDADGKHMCSAYEYEAIGLLGTNLGIADPDAIGRLKFTCDDLGIDCIEVGSAMGVAASAGKMEMGSEEGARKLLQEVEQGTEFGNTLAGGVVETAKALGVSRVPAFKGQAIPAHDGRAAKGIGVTYATSPMGADHTAGLTYRIATQKTGQITNSMRFQIQAATWDTLGYCLNSVPGGQASTYAFLADLLNARFGLSLSDADVQEIGKQTLKDELKLNLNLTRVLNSLKSGSHIHHSSALKRCHRLIVSLMLKTLNSKACGINWMPLVNRRRSGRSASAHYHRFYLG